MARFAGLGIAGMALGACLPAPVDPPPIDLSDDPTAYIESARYRRGILERDLTETDNNYARRRLNAYGTPVRWDDLPVRDPASAALGPEDTSRLEDGENPWMPEGGGRTLAPEDLPSTDAEWIELGRRVFFEYPLRADATAEAAVTLPDALASSGFLVEDDAWIGLRRFADGDRTRIGNSCAQCHTSVDESGRVSAVLSNRAMDVGRLRLLTLGYDPGDLPPEIESTAVGELHLLGPGRTDLLNDGEFNPYAFPDFGGIVDLPYLHQNANWHHAGVATLAVRCETLFITANSERSRPPRVLTWALAMFLRSLPPPPPLDDPPAPDAVRGADVFEDAGCAGCHTPPLYTSDRSVSVEEIGTDPGAGDSVVRWTGNYRIPSLRGVGRTAPYLHHGAFDTLEEMFDPERDEPGHVFGLELDEADRTALIAFLRSI